VRVRVLFFGEMRRYLPAGRDDIELDLSDGTCVADALARVGVDTAEERIVGLNGTLAKDATPLHDGDELSLYHPMGGGTSTQC
jgi:molybdopterin converting factor small subunit